MIEQSELIARLETLERDGQALRDELAIYKIIASYGPLADSSNNVEAGHAPASLWVEDGVYDLGPFGVSVGHDAIAARFAAPAQQENYARGSAHVMGLPRVEVTGDTATAFSYSRVYLGDEGESFFVQRVSANLWEFVRQNGVWKVARRTNRLVNDPASKPLVRKALGRA